MERRDISQSPWEIDGVRRGATSVQEEIERLVLPALRCDAAKFVTAGENPNTNLGVIVI